MIDSTATQELNEIDQNGRVIKCPSCSTPHQVHYFSWTGVTCKSCRKNIDSYTWKPRT